MKQEEQYQPTLGERVRLRADALRLRIRPIEVQGTVYRINSDNPDIVYVQWDEYYGWKDDDITIRQLEPGA